MSTPAVICYPFSFLERPEDRSLLIELSAAGIAPDTAKLMLYRIWADFATGGSNRRKVGADLAKDRQVRVLEGFCNWLGQPGDLVRMAIGAGFLMLERGDAGDVLVCAGFYPINSAWSKQGRSFQSRGGLSRALYNQQAKVETDASKREELWSRTRNPFEDVPESSRKDALRFVLLLCRAADFSQPTDAELAGGIFRMAIDAVLSTEEEVRKQTLLWIIGRRKEGDMPPRLDAMLREWPRLVAKSTEEIIS